MKSVLAAPIVIATVIAQTPPGRLPSTSTTLDVQFGHHSLTEPGEAISPHQAVHQPAVACEGIDVDKAYICVMLDAEVNHNGIATPVLHWLQSDLHVDDPINGVLGNHSLETVPYVGPQPIPGPPHTYVLLLFAEPPNYKFPECFEYVKPITVEARAGFNLTQFVEVTGLQKPVAANYFSAQNDMKPPEPLPSVTTTSLNSAPCVKSAIFAQT